MPLRIVLLFALLFLPLSGQGEYGRTLTLVATDLPPFYSDTLVDKGPVAHLVMQALARRGYRVELKFYPFIRATALIKAGKADAIIGLWYRREREAWAEYSAPLQSVEIGFLARKDAQIAFAELGELKGRLIGISRGYANPPAIAANGLRTEEADSDETNLRKLLLGRVDMIVISRHVATYLIEHGSAEYRGQFEFVGDVLATEVFHLGVAKNRDAPKQLVKDFNQAIEEMQKDGSMTAILSKLTTELN
ncbi:transporter substrate-binding domain-containing protein [Shewanella sp. 3B26]|uniref:Transporter substrate-binding domain-containing protein n=1 Tax=Shewanella zhuhaiensis TaxID=2919576 RepID=A0AAJ1BEZ2_9GAMM|nr:transporter substrate-binding domain-containing protein [Shewanella zhuhaiensis]